MEDGYPVLHITINGQPAKLTIHQKRRWLDELGAVSLGFEWEDRIQIVVPPDPSKGQAEVYLMGYTQDPDVAAVYRQFLKDVGEW